MNFEAMTGEAPDETIVLTDAAGAAARLRPAATGRVLAFVGTHAPAELFAPGVVRWSGVEAEPGVETVGRMVEELRRVRPESVVAVGGGSVLDAAKAAYLV